MSGFAYTLDDGSAAKRLGIIVLQVDETIESDFRAMFRNVSAGIHVTRIASGDDLTPETIAAMAGRLTASAALLPPVQTFDVIGYACTSAACQLGPDRVTSLVRAGRAARHVSDPLTAAVAALKALEAKRLSIVSPYIDSVAAPLRGAFAANGLEVSASVSFGEQVEANVARIDAASIIEAAEHVARQAPTDAVFLSCTNLRTLGVIDQLEDRLGVPVLSSNQVLAWHMAGLAGLDRRPLELPGRLGRAGA